MLHLFEPQHFDVVEAVALAAAAGQVAGPPPVLMILGHDSVVHESVAPTHAVNSLNRSRPGSCIKQLAEGELLRHTRSLLPLQSPAGHQKARIIILICILFPAHGAHQSPR